MSERDLRREIEACDAELESARSTLAALQERTGRETQAAPARRAALEAQLASLEQSLTAIAERTQVLTTERETLREELRVARETVDRLTPSQSGLGTFVADSAETRGAVFRPAGWRKSQRWYTRLLWALFEVKEWK